MHNGFRRRTIWLHHVLSRDDFFHVLPCGPTAVQKVNPEEIREVIEQSSELSVAAGAIIVVVPAKESRALLVRGFNLEGPRFLCGNYYDDCSRGDRQLGRLLNNLSNLFRIDFLNSGRAAWQYMKKIVS